MQLRVWQYADALRDGRDGVAERQAFHRTAADVEARGHSGFVGWARQSLAQAAVDGHDLDGLAEDIRAWSTVDTADLEADHKGTERAMTRHFVNCCLLFLLAPKSLHRQDTTEIYAIMIDVTQQITVLTVGQKTAIRRVAQLHGGDAEQGRLIRSRRTAGAVTGGLVPIVPRPGDRPSRQARRQPASERATARQLDRAESVIAKAAAGTASDQLPETLHILVAMLAGEGHGGPLMIRLATAVLDAAFVLAETQNNVASLDCAAEALAVVWPSVAHVVRAYARLTATADGDLDRAVRELWQARTATDPLARPLKLDVDATLAWLMACGDPENLDDAVTAAENARAHGNGEPGAADVVLARLLLWRARQVEPAADAPVDDLRRAIQLVRPQRGPRPGRWQAELTRINATHTLESALGTGNVARQGMRWYDATRAVAASSTTDQACVALDRVAWAVGTDVAPIAAEAYQHLLTIVTRNAVSRSQTAARDLVLAQAQEHTEEAGFWLARAGRYRDAVVALEIGRAVALSTVGDVRVDQGSADDVSYEDIIAAADGVLVYLGAAKGGGYALVVAGSYDPMYVELPRLDRATVQTLRSQCLPRAGARDVVPPFATSAPAPKNAGVERALQTLWENGIRDLVHMLAATRLLTLIPVGQLSLLPLHAAGETSQAAEEHVGAQHAGHFSAIRYAPNARTLRRCRATAAALNDDALTMLAADVPDGFGCPQQLDHAPLETAYAAGAWNGRAHVESDCTWERFRTRAPDHAVWHLASHASGSPYAAEKSILVFADAAVTLDEVRREFTWAPRRLVLLSACQTNLTGVDLPNEVVGFPSTLLQLGFAGAIATAWEVHDQACALLMAYFHHRWRQKREHPAIALAHARRWLRGATRAELAKMVPGLVLTAGEGPRPFADPWYWAAFAYTGA